VQVRGQAAVSARRTRACRLGVASQFLDIERVGGARVWTRFGWGGDRGRLDLDVTANGVLLTSTREAKTDFRELDERDVLDKLTSLEISQWRYKHEDEDTTHFGPVAEEFHETFGLSDGKTLNMIDTNGIAFAAIQALHAQDSATASESEALRAENRELKDRLEALEGAILD
jgi:hypothetical protein